MLHRFDSRRHLNVAVLIYVTIFSALCFLRYYVQGGPDYGIFNQAFWTSAFDGGLLDNTYEGGTHFRTHNSAVFLLLVPIYRIFPFTLTLLILQTAAMGVGAYAVFLLARAVLSAPESAVAPAAVDKAAGILALMYLWYHPMHGVNYDQINESCFTVAPFMFAFYHLHRRRFVWFWPCIVLALASKEDIAFPVAMTGLYMMGWAYFERRGGRPYVPLLVNGAMVVAVAVTWLIVTVQFVFPYFRGAAWPYFTAYYGQLGNSMPEVAVNILTHPFLTLSIMCTKVNILLAVELLAPLALLPLLAPEVVALGAPTWLVLTLSSFGGTHNTGCRYMAPLVAILFVATVVGVGRLCRIVARRRGVETIDEVGVIALLRGPLVLTILFTLAIGNTPVRFPFKNIPRITAHVAARHRLASSIPPSASVSTQGDLFAYVTERRLAFITAVPGSDYIYVDATAEGANWFHHAEWDRELARMVAEQHYKLVDSEDGVRLYRKSP